MHRAARATSPFIIHMSESCSIGNGGIMNYFPMLFNGVRLAVSPSTSTIKYLSAKYLAVKYFVRHDILEG